MCDVTYLRVCHESSACVTWLICARDVTHLCTGRVSFVRVPWLIYLCWHVWKITREMSVIFFEVAMTHAVVWRDAFMWVRWRIHVCDMTHVYVHLDRIVGVTCLLHVCDVTHANMWHDSFTCVACDMTHAQVSRDSSYEWHAASTCVTWLMHTCDMTHWCLTAHECMRCGAFMFESCHERMACMSHVTNSWCMS